MVGRNQAVPDEKPNSIRKVGERPSHVRTENGSKLGLSQRRLGDSATVAY